MSELKINGKTIDELEHLYGIEENHGFDVSDERAMLSGLRELECVKFLLSQIMSDLPSSRDWLDPALERAANCAIAGLPIGHGILVSQEPKYAVNWHGKIINRATGKAIPDDEPVFVFRAKDSFAINALSLYATILKGQYLHDHAHAVQQRIDAFHAFAKANPERMKLPDTAGAFSPGTERSVGGEQAKSFASASAMRTLTPDAEEDRADFISEYGYNGNCSCHISPPCASCMHPGNPNNQESNDSCWEPVVDAAEPQA